MTDNVEQTSNEEVDPHATPVKNLCSYEQDALIKCPHCGEEQEEPAVDHCVMDAREGLPTTDDCWSCGAEFVTYFDKETKKVMVHC